MAIMKRLFMMRFIKKVAFDQNIQINLCVSIDVYSLLLLSSILLCKYATLNPVSTFFVINILVLSPGTHMQGFP